jgi:hypothetical protein
MATKRNIFEEVATPGTVAKPQTGTIASERVGARRGVRLWLSW